MNDTLINKKSAKAHDLDKTTQDIISRQAAKDRNFRFWCYFSLSVVLLLLVLSIYRQNQIASENKQHIDCIVRLFAQPNRANKVISNVSECRIDTV